MAIIFFYRNERFPDVSRPGVLFISGRQPVHCKEIPVYILLENKLRGLSPNFYCHVSVSELYIPTIGPPIFLQQNRQTDRGKI